MIDTNKSSESTKSALKTKPNNTCRVLFLTWISKHSLGWKARGISNGNAIIRQENQMFSASSIAVLGNRNHIEYVGVDRNLVVEWVVAPGVRLKMSESG